MKRPGRLLFAMLALAGIGLFSALGAWQWERAQTKRKMLADTAELLSARVAVPLASALTGDARSYTWVEGAGHFDTRGPLLLDNQMRDGRPGVRAYRLFLSEPDDAPLLVELGWLPMPADRTLPEIALPPGRVSLQGLLMPPPSAGLALGPGIVPAQQGWLMTRVDMAAIGAATGVTPAARVLRPDPALALGYARDLDILPNTLPPEKHRGYAFQWWALAATVFVVWLVLGLRKGSR